MDKFIPPRNTPVIVAAGEEKTVPMNAGFYRIMTATSSDFDIAVNLGDWMPSDVGLAFIAPPGERFEQIRVRNRGTQALTLNIQHGVGSYEDNRLHIVRLAEGKYLPVMEGRTRLAGWNAGSIAASTNVDFSGVPPTANDIKRQSILVTNKDAALNLEIYDKDGNVFAEVFPGKQVILPCSEFVRVRNPNGSALSVRIGEIWTCAAAVN